MGKTLLTDTQASVLKHAIEQTNGELLWFPESLKGGARQKVMNALLDRGFIKSVREQWRVTPAAYASLGLPVPKKPKRERENSKQAQVIALLLRPEGATLTAICEKTAWQSHTVRGFCSTLRKKTDFQLLSGKTEDGERVYRLVEIQTKR